jgi:hypothetical protein
MTDQPQPSADRDGWRGPEQAGQPTPPPATEPPAGQTFEQRMEDFGHRAEAAGERFGREAEAAAERWSKDPSVVAAGDTAARVWGLVVLGAGLWFFTDITLGMDMPAVAWRDVWPLALIVLGLVVVLRGVARRRA